MSLLEETLDATLEADGTLRLSHPPQVPPGPVRVTIQVAVPRRTIVDVLDEIHAGQIDRGYTGRTNEEMIAEEAERQEEDEERDRELDAARRPMLGEKPQ